MYTLTSRGSHIADLLFFRSLSLSLSLSVSLVREGTARWADTGLARLMRSRPMRWVTERRVAAVCLSVRPSVYLNER